MKKQIIGGLFALVALFFTVVGCRKDIQTVTSEPTQVQSKADAVKGDFRVENGVLHFKNVKSMRAVVEQLNKFDMSERYHFGEQIGFKSYLSCFTDVLQKSAAADDKDYDGILKDNADVIDAKNDGTFQMRIVNKNLASVLDRNGIVYIGKAVYRFTDFGEAIALNGDVDRLKAVTATMVSDDNIKVFASNPLGLRGACGWYAMRNGVKSSNGTRAADLWCAATAVKYQLVDDWGFDIKDANGNLVYDIDYSSYAIGTPWKPRTFGGWKTYNADNTLAINQSLKSSNNLFTYSDNLTYSNTWTCIDFNGTIRTLPSISEPNVESNRSAEFTSYNNTYSNTAIVVINLQCQ